MHFTRMECSFVQAFVGHGLVGDDDVTVSWWEAHKDTILKIIYSKRADVTAGIKQAFLCK